MSGDAKMKKLMAKMKNYGIKKKLSVMTRVMIAFMLVLGLGAMFGAWELNHQTKELHSWTSANDIIAELDYKTAELRMEQYAHVISTTASELKKHEANIEAISAEVKALIAEYESTIQSETDRQYFDAAKVAWATYLDVTGEEFYAHSRYMELEEANAIMLGEAYDAFAEFQENFDILLEFNHAGAEEASPNIIALASSNSM